MSAKRPFFGVAKVGLVWMILWGAIGAILSIVIGIIDPPSIDPGEGPVDLAIILGSFGAISGVIFGLVLAIGEGRREVADVHLLRAAMWGMAAGAAPQLHTASEGLSRVMNGAVLGAVAAVVTVALARAVRRRQPTAT